MDRTKNKPSKIIIFGGGFILIVMLIGIFAPSSQTNAGTQENNSISDLNKFANYHKQLVAIEKPLDNANDIYQRKSKIALRNGDLYALYDSAKNLHDASMQALYSLSKINVPDLNNQNAQQLLDAIQDNFNTYIGAVREISANIMAMANTGNPSPEVVNNVQQENNMYETASIDLAVNIIKTYNALGVKDIDKIDIYNGGLQNNHIDNNIKVAPIKLPPININQANGNKNDH